MGDVASRRTWGRQEIHRPTHRSGPRMKTKLILELGCNHQGDIDIAQKMIDATAELGAWAVKFQKRDIESFSEGLKLLPRKPENSFGPNYYEHRKALELTIDQIARLRNH